MSVTLHAILDADLAAARGWILIDLARAYLAGGARLIQLRAKHLPGNRLLDEARQLVEVARTAAAQVIVNDRADIARLAGAAGVHLGQEDLSPEAARQIVGPDAAIGLSTHSDAQVAAAAGEPVSYVAVGPVFDTPTKTTGYRAVGLDLVARAAAGERGGRGRPIVAIGGITLDRAEAVIEAGASSVAVIGDLLATGDPEGRVRAYLSALG